MAAKTPAPAQPPADAGSDNRPHQQGVEDVNGVQASGNAWICQDVRFLVDICRSCVRRKLSLVSYTRCQLLLPSNPSIIVSTDCHLPAHVCWLLFLSRNQGVRELHRKCRTSNVKKHGSSDCRNCRTEIPSLQNASLTFCASPTLKTAIKYPVLHVIVSDRDTCCSAWRNARRSVAGSCLWCQDRELWPRSSWINWYWARTSRWRSQKRAEIGSRATPTNTVAPFTGCFSPCGTTLPKWVVFFSAFW